jgi:WD40 repeat protein
LDGTLRIWDLSLEKFVYQFVGYKVWLGSVWTDGDRIVSDGADNTLIVHDFSLPKVDDESSKRDASSKDGPPPPPYDPMI